MSLFRFFVVLRSRTKVFSQCLDAVVDYLPSPLDIGDNKGVERWMSEKMNRKPDDDEPFSALAFKIMNDPFVGSLTFARIYSGTIKSGSYVIKLC